MESNTISSIIKCLEESRNKQSIYQNLVQLKRIVTSKGEFTSVLKCGGIRNVVSCLLRSNAGIIDTALSILGNCCTEQSCAKEVIRYHGIRILVGILKNWAQDSIICRTCRVIGNIAQFDNYASEFYKYGVVPIVVNILNKSTVNNETENKDKSAKLSEISMGTLVMAVRVLRLLWESYSNRQNMIQDGVVRAVSLVLIKYTELWIKKEKSESVRKSIEKLLENVLKCLLLFSKWGTLECAQQISANGNGFKTLVSLIELNPYLSVKCLTNLSHVATSRSDIANAAAVDCIVKKLRTHLEEKPSERCSNDIISAFCLFCRHPMNCSEVKRAGGLQLILQVLKNCKSTRQEYQIVNALSGFHFDEQSQEMLMSNGVVKIISDCLERNLKTADDLNVTHDFVNRKHANVKGTTCTQLNEFGKRTREETFLEELTPTKLFCMNDSFSLSGPMTPPDSDSSPCSSPSCTPPRKQEYNVDDDDDSVNYSPVCSDVEPDSGEDEPNKKSANVLKAPESPLSEQEVNDEYDNEKTHFESSDLQEKTIIIMLVVLSRVSHMKPSCPNLGLGSKHTIVTLLKYLRESKHPTGRVTTLLTKIISNPDNLVQLIQSGSIQLIYNLTDLEHDLNCSMCFRMYKIGHLLLNHVTDLAESESGKQLLFHLMQTSNESDKKKCVISIPFIVKLKPMLLKFMDGWSGLNLLMSQFSGSRTERYQTTAALNQLACNININNPINETLSKTVSKLSDHYEFNSSDKNVITIKLDDGSTVNTDRDFLIERAEYFKVMLTGSFKESNEQIIKLKKVSNSALQCLLNLLTNNYQKNEPQQLKVNLATILEVIVLTDIYLMEKLTDWLTRCVEQYSLKISTACEIYNWSIVSGTNFLRIETVAFVLTAKMKDCERFQLFENIAESGFSEEIQEDVRRLISRYLKIR